MELARDIQQGKDIDMDKLYRDTVNSKDYSHLDNKFGDKKIFVLTLMVCTRMSELDFVKLTDEFAKSLPAKDWSKNVMQCSPDKIDWRVKQ